MSDTSPSTRRLRSILIVVAAVVVALVVAVVVMWQVTGATSVADLLMKFKPGGF